MIQFNIYFSETIRKVILTPLIGMEIDENLYAKMLEDTVVFYLKRIFRQETILSFSSSKGQKNPDLIIETIDNPILLEIGINKTSTKQVTKSKINYKYGIIINSKTNEITVNEIDKIVIIPLKYFLLI